MNPREFIDSFMETQEDEALIQERLAALKPEINNLLLVNLPSHITIKQANVLSELIYHIIANPDRYFA